MMEALTPEQKLKQKILAYGETGIARDIIKSLTGEQIDSTYLAKWDDDDLDSMDEAQEETRGGYEYETTIDPPGSRNYESKSVASMMLDGSYVGWTYWYGGGKHGEPEAIDWIGDAYDLDVTEEQKLVTVRKWSKK